MTEQRAIKLCLQHRDPTGFEYLVRQFRREAFLHAVTLLGNRQDAEDACQVCFVKAFRAMPSLPRLDSFYPWFYRILRNHCLNAIARRQTRQKHAAQLYLEYESNDATSPAGTVARRDDKEQVRRALSLISPEQREILVMKYIEDLRYDDIALRIGIPRGTVMSRLYHARNALRKQLRSIDEHTFEESHDE